MITSLCRAQVLARQGYRCADCRRPAQRSILTSRRMPAFWFDEHAGRWRDGEGNLTSLARNTLSGFQTVQVELTIISGRGLCQACAAKEIEAVESWETAEESQAERIEHARKAALVRWELRASAAIG